MSNLPEKPLDDQDEFKSKGPCWTCIYRYDPVGLPPCSNCCHKWDPPIAQLRNNWSSGVFGATNPP